METINIETKICNKCNIEKPIIDFNIKKSMCKLCEKEYKREYYLKNRDKVLKKVLEYRENNKEKVLETSRKYKRNNRQLLRDKAKVYYYEHREELKGTRLEYKREYNKKYYEDNKDDLKAKKKQYAKDNADKLKEKRKIYEANNRKKIQETHRKYLRGYNKTRKEKDPLFKIIIQVRSLVSASFTRRGYTKRSHTYEILGTDYNTFYNHLMKTFKKNYGYEWDGKEDVHIDHIKPLATAKTEEEIIKLCYYKNLQLLKAKDNLEKNDKIDWKLKS